MRDGLIKAKEKLSKYYGRTIDHIGDIYGVATILAPEFKLSFFETEEWQGDEEEFEWVRIATILIITLINIVSVTDIDPSSRS